MHAPMPKRTAPYMTPRAVNSAAEEISKTPSTAHTMPQRKNGVARRVAKSAAHARAAAISSSFKFKGLRR